MEINKYQVHAWLSRNAVLFLGNREFFEPQLNEASLVVNTVKAANAVMDYKTCLADVAADEEAHSETENIA